MYAVDSLHLSAINKRPPTRLSQTSVQTANYQDEEIGNRRHTAHLPHPGDKLGLLRRVVSSLHIKTVGGTLPIEMVRDKSGALGCGQTATLHWEI